MGKRNIGVVADGPTDRLIFLKIAESILSEEMNQIELRRQSIRDAIDKYWAEANRTGCYWLPDKPAETLRNSTVAMLTGAFADFSSEIGPSTHSDIVLINTDAERHLTTCEDYFKSWAFCAAKILSAGVELFYHLKIREGHQRECLPFIIPIVSFPSTDVFVAAARGETNLCGKNASQLKQALYGTAELRDLQDGEFQEKALNFMDMNGIESMFRYLPESRTFIQSLFLIRGSGQEPS